MGSSPSAPSPPTLDTAKSEKLTRSDYQLKEKFTPRLAAAAGAASRREYNRNLEFALGQLGNASIASRYEAAMPEQARRRSALLQQLDAAQQASPEYARMQRELADISGGSLGRALTAEAERRAQAMGRLSPEEERDATQQARASMAARGLATGNAGIGAELLNRDRFVQQRRAQDINLVTGVGAANEQRRVGYAGQAMTLAEQERMRRMGSGQDAYNFSMSSSPQMMALGMGSGYANMTQPAMALMGGQNVQAQYSGGSFSGQGGGMGGNMGMAAGGALTGAATGAMMGAAAGGIGAIPGAIIGGLAGGAAGYLSDKRTKTDIKLLGKVTSLLDLPAYEYRYKGEKKKRKGVMAQDVQKVLPEAVAEIDYEGKKRLAIKPVVIGAALAEQLAADTKPVALAS
jgi:hypothetical protein